jgi:hypothetical protein
VVLLRSRPGRPRWQLTTRPTTAVVLGLVSLAAAGAQLALLSSPPPWYQLAVAGFWTLVGLAFLGSAAGTRARRRRAAAAARTRVPVAEMPFVPVPVRPARPRRREEREGAGPSGDDGSQDAPAPRSEPDTGAPTDDLADAVRTAATPIVTSAVLASAPDGGGPAASSGGMPRLAARLAAPVPAPARPPAAPRAAETAVVPAGPAPAVPAPRTSTTGPPADDPDEPTTTLPRTPGRHTGAGSRDRYAVRAVLSAEFAARELEQEAERMRSAGAGETLPLRDGRVRDRRAAAEALPEGAAPDGAVPSPRAAADDPPSTPTRTQHRRARGSRRRPDETTGSRRRASHDATHRHRPEPRSGRRSHEDGPEGPAAEESVARPAPDERPAPAAAEESVARPSSLSFGAGAAAAPLARSPRDRGEARAPLSAEARTPEPRDPSSDGRPTRRRPADTGRHARSDAPEQRVSGDGHGGARRARHAASS